MWQQILFIGMGAAIGANARYLIGRWVGAQWGTSFPYGTLIINLLGCLLIGIFFAWEAKQPQSSLHLRLFITTGLLGGFTTFSSFGYETVTLIERGDWTSAALYVGLSVVIGIGAVGAGFALVRGVIH